MSHDQHTRRELWQSARARQDYELRRLANVPWAEEPRDSSFLTRLACAMLIVAIITPLVFPNWFREPEPTSYQGESR